MTAEDDKPDLQAMRDAVAKLAKSRKGGKAAPRGWEPPKPGPAVAPGPSPFDALDPAKIPAAERGPWLPAATVAVVGGHAGMHDGALTSRATALSPDGKWIASANGVGVWIWDAATLRPRYYHPVVLSGLSFSPDGKQFAFGCGQPEGGQMVRLIDLSGPEPRPLKDVAPRWENGMRGIAFLPDGKSLVTATGHGGIYLWDLTGPGDQPARVIRKEIGYQKGAVSQLTLSADGTKVFVATDDDGNKRQLVGGYDLATGKELFSFPQLQFAFAASPAGDRVVSLRETGGKWKAVVRDVTGAEPKELGIRPRRQDGLFRRVGVGKSLGTGRRRAAEGARPAARNAGTFPRPVPSASGERPPGVAAGRRRQERRPAGYGGDGKPRRGALAGRRGWGGNHHLPGHAGVGG